MVYVSKVLCATGGGMGKLLVLGVGNLLLTDDGVGVLAAQELMQRDWPANVTVREGGTFTHDIFYSFGGFDHLLVLDVVHAGGEPGCIYELTEEALVENPGQRLSLHDIDLLDSLRMAERYFGSRPRLDILGMEPFDHTTWNIGLSPEVEAAFPRYLELAARRITELAAAQNSAQDPGPSPTAAAMGPAE